MEAPTLNNLQQCHADDEQEEDRLSALPDHILCDILERLPLRTAVQATTLARRWSHLLRLMCHLKISVADFFIPRPTAAAAATLRKEEEKDAVPRAMAAYTEAARRLLSPTAERTIRTLLLRFYLTDYPNLLSIGRTVGDAVESGKTELLEFSLLPEVHYLRCTEEDLVRFGQRFMSFLEACPGAFRWLTSLALDAIRFGDSDIPNLLSSCQQLQHLTLYACDSGRRSTLKIDAPHSQLRTLKIFFCSYYQVQLIHVPKLERVDCDSWMGINPPVCFGRVPLLDRICFACSPLKVQLPFRLSDWLSCAPSLTSMYLDFYDEMVWILPEGPKKLSPILRNLRDVYLYNISPDCGIKWTLFVLEGAPSLERFHVKISRHICEGEIFEHNAQRSNVLWETSSDVKHKNLRLLDMLGFEAEDNLMEYIKLVMQRAVGLRRIHLHDKEQCDECDNTNLEMPSLDTTRFPTEEGEKDLIREKLMEGFSSPVEIIIG